ncbi:MAG: hypothetical protein JNJ61_18160 [Anaerolineae bacterium]|nr:hypothetical protein [Anaerolineae bacterium]
MHKDISFTIMLLLFLVMSFGQLTPIPALAQQEPVIVNINIQRIETVVASTCGFPAGGCYSLPIWVSPIAVIGGNAVDTTYVVSSGGNEPCNNLECTVNIFPDWDLNITLPPNIVDVPIFLSLSQKDPFNIFGPGMPIDINLDPVEIFLELQLDLNTCLMTGDLAGNFCGTNLTSGFSSNVGFNGVRGAQIWFTISRDICTYSTTSFQYKSYGTIQTELQRFAELYPALANVEDLHPPTTEEGRSITAIKISDNAAETEDEPRVLFVGAHHAREWISTEIPLHLADYLLSNYDSCTEVRRLVNNSEIWIIPVANPDGYEYSRTGDPNDVAWNSPRQWRKNRNFSPTLDMYCKMLKMGPAQGVDTNRNYETQNWSLIDNSSFSSRCDYITFKGAEPFSEPETQAIRNLMDPTFGGFRFDGALSYHSYAEAVIYPGGNADVPDNPEIEAMAYLLVNILNDPNQPINTTDPNDPLYDPDDDYYAVQSCCFYPGTPISGTFDDWLYERYYALDGQFRFPVFTIELTPGKHGTEGFNLREEKIEPVWEANKPAALCLIKYVIQGSVPTDCLNGAVAAASTNLSSGAAAQGDIISVTAPPDREVQPEQNITLPFTLQNLGTVTDTFDLIIGRGDEGEWVDATNLPAQITIDAGASVIVEVPIIVPPANENPDSALITVLAISQSNPDIRGQDGTNLTIRPANLYVNIEPASSNPVDIQRQFTITYGNRGNTAAVNVAVGIEIPPNIDYVSSSRIGIQPLFDDIQVWYLGTVPANFEGTIEVTIVAPEASNQGYPLLQVGIASGMTQAGYTTRTPEADIDDNSDAVSSGALYTALPASGDATFDPNIRKIGFASQVGNTTQIEWIITVTNQGNTAGINVVIVDDVPQGLRIDRVENSRGLVELSGQQVKLTLDRLDAGETFEFSIFTTRLDTSTEFINSVSLTADNLDGSRTASSFAVQELPKTGETPWWQSLAMLLIGLSVAVVSVGVVRHLRRQFRNL